MADDLKIKASILAEDLMSAPVLKMAAAVNKTLTPALAKLKAAGMAVPNKLLGMAGSALTALGLGGLGAGIGLTQLMDKSSDLLKLSKRTGMTVEALQELGYAAMRAGMDSEQFAIGIDIMSRNMGGMKAQTGPMFALLSKQSPTLKKMLLGAKDNGEAFNILIDAMSRLEDPNKRALLAQAAFGRGGKKFAAMAIGGKDALQALRNEAVRLGIITTEQAEQIGGSKRALEDFKWAVEATGNSIIASFTPEIKILMKTMTEWVVQNKELIKTKVKEFVVGFADAMKKIPWGVVISSLTGLISMFGWLADKLGPVGLGIVLLLGKLGLLGPALGVVTAAIKVMGVALAANPIGILILAVATAGALIYANWEPIKQFFIDFWEKPTETAKAFFDYIKEERQKEEEARADEIMGALGDAKNRADAGWDRSQVAGQAF